MDSLSWEFIVSTVDDSNLVYPPKVGGQARDEEGNGSKNGKLVGEKWRIEELGQKYCQLRIFSPTRSQSLSRTASGFGACTWRVLAGTGRTLV